MRYDFSKWLDADVIKELKSVSEPSDNRLLPEEISFTFAFNNGLNVSVIRHLGSYGGRRGKFEAQVFHPGPVFKGFHVKGLTQPDGIAGWLDDNDVNNLLNCVSDLSYDPSE
jgi:hypothetical protein